MICAQLGSYQLRSMGYNGSTATHSVPDIAPALWRTCFRKQDQASFVNGQKGQRHKTTKDSGQRGVARVLPVRTVLRRPTQVYNCKCFAGSQPRKLGAPASRRHVIGRSARDAQATLILITVLLVDLIQTAQVCSLL